MKLLPRLTILECLTILGVLTVVGGLLLPDSATTTRWRLEKRARDFAPTRVATLADESIVATDAEIAGTWVCRHRLNRAEFTFSRRPDGQFDSHFNTRGCLGGCDLQRLASFDRGVIHLDAAVAEYLPRTYNTLYVVRIEGNDYLLPADGLTDFEQDLHSGSDGWQWYVFRRVKDFDEQHDPLGA